MDDHPPDTKSRETMKLTIQREINLDTIIKRYFDNNVDLAYCGENGGSYYTITDVTTDLETRLPDAITVEVSIDVEVEHVAGAFVSKEQLIEEVESQLNELFGNS